MYETFFGLTRRPFSTTPEPDYLVPTQMMTRALQELSIAVRAGHAIAILTGAAGTGKTLLCRKLTADLNESTTCIFLPNSNFPSQRALLQAILYELGHPYRAMDDQELRLELTTAVRSVCREGRPAVLIVDEAHLLDESLLEEFRSVTNLSEDGRSLVQVIFSGQFPLEEKLAEASLQAFNQRVYCQVTLDHLTRQESAAYVEHSLQAAGAATQEIFTPDAVELICHVCDGVPRCLSLLCDHSLLLASLAGRQPVDGSIVREALDDLKQLPLQWNDPPAAATGETDAPQSSRIGDETRPIATHEPTGETDRDLSGGIGASGPATFEPAVTAPSVSPPSDRGRDAGDEPGNTSPHNDEGSLEVIEVGATESSENDSGRNGFREPAFGRRESDPASIDVGDPAPEPSGTIDDDPLVADVFQSGSENSGPTAPSFATADGFVEEVVVDRYAMIDAGLGAPEVQDASLREAGWNENPSVPPVSSGHESNFSDGVSNESRKPAEEPETAEGPYSDERLDEPPQLVETPFVERAPALETESGNSTDGDDAADDSGRHSPPELLIDELKARLDEALAPVTDDTASEESGQTESWLQWAARVSNGESSNDDIEEQIGTAVVDTCCDVRNALQQEGYETEESGPAEQPEPQEGLFFFTPQPEATPAESNTGWSDAIYEGPFDAVEPEEQPDAFDGGESRVEHPRFAEEDSRSVSEASSQAGSRPGHRHYSNLFSRLRQRLHD